MPLAKPDFLGPEYGAQFSDASVAAAYHLRPPYPDETFELLASLMVDRPRTVLDVGTGTGDIARALVPFADRVDVVDPSKVMIARGRAQAAGTSEKLNWICAPAETAPITPPYVLVTAGASLHWMDWPMVLPRLRNALTDNGVLAIIDTRTQPVPWQAQLLEIIGRYSTNQRYRPYDLIDELEGRALFTTLGRHQSSPVMFSQSLADYVESFHARNGFSRDRMTPDAAGAFDREVADVVAPHLGASPQVPLQVVGEVTWGLPAPNQSGEH